MYDYNIDDKRKWINPIWLQSLNFEDYNIYEVVKGKFPLSRENRSLASTKKNENNLSNKAYDHFYIYSFSLKLHPSPITINHLYDVNVFTPLLLTI